MTVHWYPTMSAESTRESRQERHHSPHGTSSRTICIPIVEPRIPVVVPAGWDQVFYSVSQGPTPGHAFHVIAPFPLVAE